MADVRDDREVLERLEVLDRDDVLVARARHDDVDVADHGIQSGDLEAVHRGLQRADRIDLADDHAGTLAAQRLGRALAHVAVADDERGLAADQDVGRAVQAVGQRMADAVLVVELRLRDRVVDVDAGEEQISGCRELVEAVHTGRRLLGHTDQVFGETGEALRVAREARPQRVQDDAVLVRVAGRGFGDGARALELDALVHEHASRRRRRRG